MLFKLLFLAMLVPAALFAACGDDDDDDTSGPGGASTTAPADGGDGETATIDITAANFAFDPTEITVPDGATVTVNLTNSDSAVHSFTVGDEDVTEAEGGADSTGAFEASSDTVEFHCKYHPAMTGTITVEGASAQNIDQPDSDNARAGSAYGY